ncbi:MAG: hypothetical protein HUJ54_14205 [Erysipelotrichaceae bacterium]|nr:hypothetical protein [Erysipelotrichaceae bacterium]
MKKTFAKAAAALLTAGMMMGAVQPALAAQSFPPEFGNYVWDENDRVDKYELVEGKCYATKIWKYESTNDGPERYCEEAAVFEILRVYEDEYWFFATFSKRKAEVMNVCTGQEKTINCDICTFYECR